MGKVVEGLYYTDSEEWVRVSEGLVEIGVTDHAQDQLGDVVFLELPEAGRAVSRGEPFGVIESVKTLSDLIAPVSGEVVESNADAIASPETVNQDPYGAAWLIRIKPSALDAELGELMSAATYAEHLASQG